MSTLQQIQSDFQDYIQGKAGAHDAIAAHISDQFGLGVSERLAIYHDAYRSRMRACLGAAFEKTRACVGDDMFSELADGYMAAHHSKHCNLRWFGDQLGPFAAQALPDSPFVGELIALEWALGIAFDAPDAESIGASDLGNVPPAAWGDLVFALHPTVQILTLETNAGALWQALNDQHALPAGVCLSAPQAWLVWRLGHQAHVRSLGALEARTLSAVAEGDTFGAVCAAAAADIAPGPGADEIDLAHRMAGYLQDWLAQGLLRPASTST